MEITKTFKVSKNNIDYFVYEGFCDNVETKWITKKNEWDKKITMKFNGLEMIYKDTFGEEIIILEKDEDEYWDWIDCIKNNKNCNCLSIDYFNKKKYIDYVSKTFNITGALLHTLHLSTREQLRSYIAENHKFNINDLD